jgi:DNA-binding transcriptional MerR regulator
LKKYKISDFAKTKNIDTQTLRYYDKIGLLKPNFVDQNSKYRYYTTDQFMMVDIIKFNKLLGLSLEEIMSNQKITSIDKKLHIIKSQKTLLENKIEKYQSIVTNVESIVEIAEKSIAEYEKIKDNPTIKKYNDLVGIIGDCDDANGWYEIEKKIREISEKYPNYSEVGHNHGLIFIGPFDFIIKDDDALINKILLPYSLPDFDDENIEKYTLGRCITAYHKGKPDDLKNTFVKILDFAKANMLKTKNTVLIRSIVGSFIINYEEEFLQELIIPLAE